MIHWFFWMLTVITDKPGLNVRHPLLPKFLEEILALPDPTLRYQLGKIVLAIFEDPDKLVALESLRARHTASWKLLPCLAVFHLAPGEVLQQAADHILSLLPLTYKEGYPNRLFIAAILAVQESAVFTPIEKLTLLGRLSAILSKSSPNGPYQSVR